MLVQAGLFKRLLSMLYESLLLIAIFAFGTLIFIKFFGDATLSPKRYFLQFFLWSLGGVYFIWCWLKSGQTLAMKSWKIQLVDYNGNNLTLPHCIKRYVLASLGLIFFGCGYIWALFDREGLFLHDRLTGSKVISLETRAD